MVDECTNVTRLRLLRMTPGGFFGNPTKASKRAQGSLPRGLNIALRKLRSKYRAKPLL